MKTLLQINIVVNYGSTGRIIEEFGQTAVQNGWNSYIAYGRIKQVNKEGLIRIGSGFDVIVHGLQTRLLDRHGLGSRNATLNFIKIISQIKPDIVHLHNLHGYYINIEILFNYLEKAKIPVVWTLHDCWPITGHCVYFDSVGCEKWKTECFKCPQTKVYPASLGIDRSKQNFNLKKKLFLSLQNMTIVPVSKWLGDIVKQSFLKEIPMHTISNGIDTEVFRPSADTSIRDKYRIRDKFIILGIASNWSPRKGLADFIKLSENVQPDDQIILVGLSDKQIKTLPDRIIGLPRTDNIVDLVDLYSNADVFINPSIEETFGLTTVEALACGTPAVVFNSTASPELIIQDTGFVLEKGDMQGLVGVIKTIKTKGKSSYSLACRERVLKLYDKTDRHKDYLDLYESVLKRNTNTITNTDINPSGNLPN